jgi:hypothetical protein
MKNLFFLFLIASLNFLSYGKSNAQANDPIYDSIKLLNLDYYASKPVDSFLQAIPQSYDYIKILGYLKNSKAKGLCIYYPNNLRIWIQPKKFRFMIQNDPSRVWNLTMFKKEVASYIDIIHPDLPSLLGQQ